MTLKSLASNSVVDRSLGSMRSNRIIRATPGHLLKMLRLSLRAISKKDQTQNSLPLIREVIQILKSRQNNHSQTCHQVVHRRIRMPLTRWKMLTMTNSRNKSFRSSISLPTTLHSKLSWRSFLATSQDWPRLRPAPVICRKSWWSRIRLSLSSYLKKLIMSFPR